LRNQRQCNWQLPRQLELYISHFRESSCCFLAFPHDEGNPFKEELAPLASSPALLYSMAALAAGHMARTEPEHNIAAANHYSRALRELYQILLDPETARSDATLGACLLLCVYEVTGMRSHEDSFCSLPIDIIFRGS
jgi:hypothetical protein